MTPGSCPSDTSAHPRSRGENRPGGKPQLSTQGSSPLTRGKRSHHGGYDKRRGLIPAHAGKTTGRATVSTVATAHPRSRGENAACEGGVSAGSGSSPLTRGKRFCELRVSFDAGLIPAHAGKTLLRAARILRRRAHPRSRGENDSGCRKTDHGEGSSPLTRGKRPHERNAEMHIRLIPAHAGKTSCGRSTARAGTAHPRSRGENSRCKRRRCWSAGSSPLTRGKPSWKGPEDLDKRLIPAHAGKTGYQPHVSTPPSAHPRSRGENARYVSPQASSDGSSPLTRGKRNLCVFGHFSCRLIPAHAGKTESLCFRSFFLSAHPRSRGENGYPVSVQAQLLGSSPLTRGKRRVAPGVAQDRGLIPAHAGKTKAAQQMVVNFQAHPRSRGENDSHAPSSHEDSGSSPLTRGKRKLLSSRSSHPRLIPAHAGKT